MVQGVYRGLAQHMDYGSYVAACAEVSVDKATGKIKVHNYWIAVDPGLVVQPENAQAQVESAIVYGLNAALFNEITLKGGRVEQSNFHDYRALHINEMPSIDVHIVKSNEPPGGMGEPGTSALVPAVFNAVYAATGVRLRKPPIMPDLLRT